MKATTLIFAAMLAAPLASLAQPPAQDEANRIPAAKGGAAPNTPAASAQYGQGGSPHCDKLAGADRDQCLRDEGAKTEGKEPPASAATGATAEDRLPANRERSQDEPPQGK